ncbi:ribosomal protein s13-like protein [Microdochium bolleyi]|uniref:Ribosomal protein s13-like protein n=1 Tax=Microdochium bolleyi TaxID=196109 RepID=A0A136J7M0_9PEZI|nr:ribosomal protein s13-like protein [Microdochium bolleyi]
MVFILGVNFHERKFVKKALESFYGLGPTASARIMAKHSIFPLARLENVSGKTVQALTAELSNMTLESDAKRLVQENIRRLRDMGTYRGRRHAMNLPVRGQKTRTQIETARKLNILERGERTGTYVGKPAPTARR